MPGAPSVDMPDAPTGRRSSSWGEASSRHPWFTIVVPGIVDVPDVVSSMPPRLLVSMPASCQQRLLMS